MNVKSQKQEVDFLLLFFTLVVTYKVAKMGHTHLRLKENEETFFLFKVNLKKKYSKWTLALPVSVAVQ